MVVAFPFHFEVPAMVLGEPVVPEMKGPSLPHPDLSIHPIVPRVVSPWWRAAGLAIALTEKTENVVGGAACVTRTRIPIWTLEGYRRLGTPDEQILAAYPALRPLDLQAAWAYVALHGEEIAREIAENEAA